LELPAGRPIGDTTRRACYEGARPMWLEREIGRPTLEWSPGRRDAEQIDAYRGWFKLDDQAQALGEAPKDLSRRQAWRQVQYAVGHATGAGGEGRWTRSPTRP